MGKAIYYCVQCSKRVSDSDIESGKGFRVGDRILCADCAPADVKTVTSKRLPAVPRPKPGSTSAMPKVPHPEAPPPPPRNRMLVVGGGVLVVLLVMVVLVVLLTREHPADRPSANSDRPAPSESGSASTPKQQASVSREDSARGDLAKARAFAAAHPDDLSARLKEFNDLVWKWEGTDAGREAAREAAAVKAIIQEKVNGWMAEVEEKIADLLKSKQYAAASKKVEELKPSHDLPEWRLAAEKRASELYVLGRKLAEEEDAKKKAGDPRPGEDTPAVKPLSEEGKGQLARWEAAAAKATARDYAGAIADLERSLPGLKETDVKSEAEGDAALLRKVAALVDESIGALRQRPRGGLLTLQLRDASGAPKRVSGAILQADAERVELRVGRDSVFADWSEVASTTLTDLAQKKPFDPRALAALCLLEGDAEAARAFQVEFPPKWWTYAEGARARLPKPDPAERSARNQYCAAENEYRSMETRAAAIERYRSLRADFAATSLVKAYSERIVRRSDAGKEYYVSPVDFHSEGSLRLAKSGKLESVKDSDDKDTLLNFAELEFAALPGQSYRCWIWVAACCEETFLFYYQGSELSEVEPKTKKKIAVEPGSGFAVPVKHSIRNLKKTHLDHKPKGAAQHPKTAARWEWIEVPLPKYASPGAKKLRFMTNQAGFSIGGALVSATRKAPPSEADIKDLDNARKLDDPPMPVDPDLVGWWSFDEGAGGVVADLSGKGHAGKFVGDAKWGEGKIGSGLHIEGLKSGVEVADAEDLRIPGDLTMALWVRKAAEPKDWVCIMGRGTWERRNYGLWLDSRAPRYMWQQYDAQGGKVSDINVYGKKTVEVGKWVHLAATIERDLIKVYLDGELDNQGRRPAAPWAEAAPLGIGFAMGHSALKGDLDDVRLYRRALTADEIRAVYCMGR
jgi:hypothetical protein